ncbi:MAG: hypothetical protein Q9168_005371 [Polycauliona sp. 1 TL-2023]
MDQIREEVQGQYGLDAKKFMPIHEETHVEVDGALLKMEFLHPSKGDEHHVILLLLVAKGNRTLLVRFEWDCRDGLSRFERKPSQALPNSERPPLLLIPLTYGTSFAVVYEHQITVYKDILTGNAEGQICPLEHCEPREESGRSKRIPIWTQWARPMRPKERREPGIDNIYLCREDGVVRYIDIKENSHPMISCNYDAGILNANLSSAFATLDLGDESNDGIIAAGGTSDGGVWHLKPRKPVELVGTIRNWTPLRSMTTTKVVESTKNHVGTGSQVVRNGSVGMNASTTQKSTRLFACSGQGRRHGAITEIRMGTEAVKLCPATELGESDDNGILDLWALPAQPDGCVYLMIARPMETELIRLRLPFDEPLEALSEVDGVVEGINLNERTIAAGSTAEGLIVQVTPSSVNAVAQGRQGIAPLAWHEEGVSITAASFFTCPSRTTLLLIVLQRHYDFYLHHGHLGSQGGHIIFQTLGEPIRLPSGASSVALYWDESRIIAFVGTSAATLQVYIAKAGSSLSLCFEHSFNDPSSICDSLAILTSKTQGLAFQQGPLTCVAQASTNIPQGYSEFAAGSLLYLSGSTLDLADINSSPKPDMVPRHLPFSGTPSTVLYSDRLGRLIVVYTTEVPHAGIRMRKGIAVKRTASQPAIALISPDAEPYRLDQDKEDRLNVLDASCALPGEKYLGLMEWFPTDGKKQYHMLVVHTATGQAGSQVAIGRLLFFSPVLNAGGDVTLKKKIDLEHHAEICAVTPYGESSLIYGCGNDIYFCVLDLENKKFKPPMKLPLRSPAVHISVQGPNIHVSTESHGHHILSVQEASLIPCWADRTSRLSAYHLIAPERSLVITTDFEGRIAGLWQPPQPQLDRTAPLIFEAFLPRPITKLCSIRKEQKQFQLSQPERQSYLWGEQHLPKEVILGSSEDGTIYQLSLLDEASWRLLAYIQNMAVREPRICPYQDPWVLEGGLEPSLARKEGMHIDGDLLMRLLERGGTTLLKEMLGEHGPDSRMLLDEMQVEDHPEDRWQRLRALFTDVFGGDATALPQSNTPVTHVEVVEIVLGWIRSLLLSAI